MLRDFIKLDFSFARRIFLPYFRDVLDTVIDDDYNINRVEIRLNPIQ